MYLFHYVGWYNLHNNIMILVESCKTAYHPMTSCIKEAGMIVYNFLPGNNLEEPLIIQLCTCILFKITIGKYIICIRILYICNVCPCIFLFICTYVGAQCV